MDKNFRQLVAGLTLWHGEKEQDILLRVIPDKLAVRCNKMSATSVGGGAIWWTLMKERQTWYNLQVKNCVIHVWVLCEYMYVRVLK